MGAQRPGLLCSGRSRRRCKAQIGPQSPHNGILGDARRSTAELGKRVFDMRVDYAVRQIRSLLTDLMIQPQHAIPSPHKRNARPRLGLDPGTA